MIFSRALWSKMEKNTDKIATVPRAREWAKWAVQPNERTDERVAQYCILYSWLLSTTVQCSKLGYPILDLGHPSWATPVTPHPFHPSFLLKTHKPPRRRQLQFVMHFSPTGKSWLLFEKLQMNVNHWKLNWFCHSLFAFWSFQWQSQILWTKMLIILS